MGPDPRLPISDLNELVWFDKSGNSDPPINPPIKNKTIKIPNIVPKNIIERYIEFDSSL